MYIQTQKAIALEEHSTFFGMTLLNPGIFQGWYISNPNTASQGTVQSH